MWPWGHLGVGYLSYALLLRIAGEEPPTEHAALALAVGTLFPDLVDKPLAWYVGVLPTGRTLAHSALTAVLVLGVGWAIAARVGDPRTSRRTWAAFGVGYATHVLSDGVPAVVGGAWGDLAYLAYPVVAVESYPTEQTLVEQLATQALTPGFVLGLVVFAAGAGVWIRHGRPGWTLVRRWVVQGLSVTGSG